MQQFTIRVPDEYLAGIEKIATITGLKKSDIARMAIKRYIEEYKAEKEKSNYGRAKDLIGVVASGISDLGKNHRNYMIQKIRGKKQ